MRTNFAKFTTVGAVPASVALFLAPQTASALQFEYMGKFNGFKGINYTRDNSISGTSTVGPRNSNPGVFSMRELGSGVSVGDPYTPGVDDFLAWCFDVDKLITTGTALNYTLDPNMLEETPPYRPGATNRVQKLFDKSYSLDSGTGVLSTDAKSAGFQIAIWEVLYDEADSTGAYDLDSGAFTVNSGDTDAITAANEFLDGTATFTGPKAWNIALYKSSDRQNIGVATAIPLPAAAWLLLGVSGALVAAKRRSARRA